MEQPKPPSESEAHPKFQKSRHSFNRKLWEWGTKVEDAVCPHLNELWGTNFKKSKNIFETIDFHDEESKVACEVKGRRISSTQYKDTIIPYGKWVEACKLLDEGWDVYYVFVYTDKTKYIKLTGEEDWKVKLTGSFGIEHHLIPIDEMEDLL
ncbi:MAG: hypothetical protein CMM62_20580 [Rhodospirillaceae bacterium]|jgi:hypothetical protein|nr:hypothetical protein [Rhodospirillaceae bacterium]|tara:strand:+ start:1292 stop:1747 length:456 start_codon:yes stop_codon:yes gene_type:complete